MSAKLLVFQVYIYRVHFDKAQIIIILINCSTDYVQVRCSAIKINIFVNKGGYLFLFYDLKTVRWQLTKIIGKICKHRFSHNEQVI